MFYIKIAKLLVQVNNHYDLIRQQCQPYLVEPHREPDLVMEADEKEIAFGKAWFLKHEHTEITDAASEFSRAPYTIYPQLPQFDALWLHSAVMEMDGEGYAVTAPSGYGKTTHARLWLKAFPGKARIINGDNPIFRKENEGFMAYGTPFCGKEGYQVNIGVPLRGFCYLKHGEANSIRRLEPSLAFGQLMREYQGRFTQQNQEKYIELLQHFAEKVPIYVLTCNMDAEAAVVAYEGMKHGGN